MRALARVDLGAIERNCARLAAVAAPARLCAVVKADGYGHGAVPAARAAQAGGAAWLAVATAGEAVELRAAGIEGPLLVMGALSPAELDVALEARRRRRRLARGVRAPSLRASGVGVHVKLDTGMGRLGTRDPDEAARVVRGRGATGCAWRRDDPLRHRRRGRPRLPATSSSRRFEPLGGAPTLPACSCTPRTPPPRCASRPPGSTWCAAASPIYGMDPFHRDPADHGLEPALELVSYVAEVKRTRGRGRAPATAAASSPSARRGSARSRSATATACAARSPTTPTCSSAAAACRWWGPSRWTTSPSTSATSRSSAAPRRC